MVGKLFKTITRENRWNTYLGDERSGQNPNFRTRLFTDVYAIYNPNGKFSGTACFYIGSQEQILPNTESRASHNWWTANIIGRYRVTPKISLAGRLEYFNDPNQIQITPITPEPSFSTYSASLGLNIDLIENIMLRFESRSFFAKQRVYLDNLGRTSDQTQMLVANITAFF
jgi:Putative beta-barrel porin-2, OmpL-like. bbp2